MLAQHGAALAETLDTAIRYHVKSHLTAAQRLYRVVLVDQPDHADALHLLGVAAHQEGRNRQAVALIEAAIVLNGAEAVYHSNLAIVLKDLRRPVEACRACHRAVELRPDYPEAHVNMAHALRDIGDLSGAMNSAKRAVCLSPSLIEGQANLDIVFFHQQQFGQAVLSNHRTIRLDASSAEAHSNRASFLTNLGRVAEALISCKAALSLKPASPDALSNFLVLMARSGNADRAGLMGRAAVRMAPGSAMSWSNQANLSSKSGQLVTAAAGYRLALCLDPSMAETYASFGALLSDMSQAEGAVLALRRAIRIRPSSPEALSNLASALLSLNRFEDALRTYHASLRSRADLAEVHANYAYALKIAGRLPEALLRTQSALCISPDLTLGHANRGDVLNEMGDYRQAHLACKKAVLLNPLLADAHIGFANSARGLGREKEVLSHCDSAIVLTGRRMEIAYINKGVHLMEMGDFAGARHCIGRALIVNPSSAKGWYALSQVSQFRAESTDIPRMCALSMQLDEGQADISDRINLRFAIAKGLTDIGDPEGAYRYQEEGNRLKRSTFIYDADETDRHMAEIANTFDADFMARWRSVGNPSSSPLFIVGMPRSGTTLVEQILSSHPLVFGGGERAAFRRIVDLQSRRHGPDYPKSARLFTDGDLADCAEAYLADILSACPDGLRVTDKMPLNFLFAGLIHLTFPNAKIIHIHRDAVDTCLSIYSKNFTGSQPFAYDLGELGRYYKAYEGLMTHWRSLLPASAFIEVEYEILVRDFETEVRRLVNFCGLDWNAACLEFHTNKRAVRTASLNQVRQPIYTSSIGRERPSDALLRPLLDELDK